MTKSSVSPVSPARAAVYCRVSTDRQEREGTSLDSQWERSLAYAAERGYAVAPAHVYSEAASATTWRDRPKLQAMLVAARAGEIDVLIVYATDRLSRKQTHSGVIWDRLEEAGVRLESVTEPDIDKTALGQFLRSVRAFVAETENEDRAERSVRGKLTRVKSGKLHNHGTDLYGYRRDKEKGVRVVYEPEAGVVRLIFHWYVIDHLSMREIVRRLHAEGVPSPAASGNKRHFKDGRTPRWGRGTVHRILTEPAYKGVTLLWRFHNDGTRVEHRLRPEDEWIALDGVTPDLVTPDLWRSAQERLAHNVGAETRNATRPALLRGLISCARCGLPMRAVPDRDRLAYRCSSREKPGGPCGGKRVPAKVVEAELWAELTAHMADPALRDREVARLRASNDVTGLEAERTRAKERVTRFTRQVEALGERLRTLAADDIIAGVMEGQLRQAEQARREAVEDLAPAEAAFAAHEAAIARLENVHAYCAQVAPNMADFDFTERREALEALDLRVHANGRAWHAMGDIPGEGEGIVFRSSSRSCTPSSTTPAAPASASRNATRAASSAPSTR